MTEKTEDFTDLQIVERVKGGDKKAFSILVKRHQRGLMRLSVRFVKDIDMAEDVVQESFIKAYERLASFEARASFKSWLFQIAVNTAKNKLRERKEGTFDIQDVQLGIAPQAESTLVQTSVSQIIQKFVDDLPQRQKTALVLRVYEDLSFKEIADIMECPYDTAKANYRHALMKLKGDIETHQELQNWKEDVGGFVMEMTRRVVEADA
ncbi:MAG: RNA polymerase sigma-H factor [Oligoflexia bacterium]|nr:MAG: RNA polymerase sigma-H factor [Oligoflexia bacterium]